MAIIPNPGGGEKDRMNSDLVDVQTLFWNPKVNHHKKDEE